MFSNFRGLLFLLPIVFYMTPAPCLSLGDKGHVAPSPTKDSLYIDSLLGVIFNYTGTDLDKAIAISDSLSEFCVSTNNTWGIARMLLKKAELYNLAGREQEAFESAQSCIAYLDLYPNASILSGAYSILGWYYQDKEQLALADSFYLRALRVAESINDSAKISYAYNHLGLINQSTRNFEKAIAYHHQSINYNPYSLSNRSKGADVYNLGSAFHRMGNTDSALYYYKIAEKYYEGENYYSGLAGIANNMGRHFQKTGWYDSAVIYLEKALFYDLKVGTHRYICMDYINLASVYLSMRNYTKSIDMAKKAMDLANQAGYLQQQYQANNILHKLYAEKGQYKLAHDYLSKSKCLSDSIHKARTADKVAELEAIYNLEKKEAENQHLKDEQKRSNEIIRLLWGGSLIILSFLIFSLTLLAKVRRQNDINRALNSKLQQSNDELKVINTTKDKFFSIISHDLKGPIGTLQTMLELYLSKDITDKDYERFNQFMTAFSTQTKHTSNLLENLLTWSRIQFGQSNFSPGSIDIAELIQQNCDLANYQAKLKGIEIINESLNRVLPVFADKNMMDVVIRNLISNAIKFTGKNGTIRITSNRTEEKIMIAIQDSGIGMTQQQLDELFQLEKRLLSTGTSDEKGTGLGLLLCKEFTEMNNGQISVDSKTGNGSTFTLQLPVAKS